MTEKNQTFHLFKKLVFVKFLLISIFVLFNAMPVMAESLLLDRIVAKVNSEVITLSELVEFIRAQEYMNPGLVKEREKKDRMLAYLNSMIEEKLAAQEAKKLDLEISDEEVNSSIDFVLQQNKMTLPQLKEALEKQGISFPKYKQSVKEQLQKTKLINIEVRSKVSIEEQEILQYYRQKVHQEFSAEPRVKLSQLFFICPEIANNKDCTDQLKNAEKALKMLDEGKSWKEIIIEFSADGRVTSAGSIGDFKIKDLNEIFLKEINNLSAGEHTNVFSSPNGYHILMVDARTSESSVSFDEVKDQIRMQIFEEKFETYKERWMNRLRSSAYLEIKL